MRGMTAPKCPQVPHSVAPPTLIKSVEGVTNFYNDPMAYVFLIADDEPALRTVLSLALKMEGHTVEAVIDGQEVMDMLNGGLMPDAVIVDNHMPRKSGIEVCREIRSNPKWDAVALMLLTADEDEKIRNKAKASGADAIIPKALKNSELRGRIRETLDKKRENQSDQN